MNEELICALVVVGVTVAFLIIGIGYRMWYQRRQRKQHRRPR